MSTALEILFRALRSTAYEALGDLAPAYEIEQTSLLRACNEHLAGRALRKHAELFLAELRMQWQRPAKLEGARERLLVERHGAIAIADVQLLVVNAHCLAPSGPLVLVAPSGRCGFGESAGAAIASGGSPESFLTGESITCPSAVVSVFGGSKM